MNNRENILEELREISPVIAGINKTEVYKVPFLYFEYLPKKILSKIKGEENITSNNSAYTTKPPEGYFETLADKVLLKIKQQEKATEIENELAEVAPFLNTINKTNIYTVPSGYFDLFKVVPHESGKKAKVVTLQSFSRKFLRYAAAAIITTIIALSAYLFYDKNVNSTPASATNTNISSAVKSLSNDEILEYLKTHSNSANVTQVYFNSKNQDQELNKTLKEMSEEEIKQYLRENSEPGEIEVDI